MNRIVREVTNCWNYEDTQAAYQALGWMNVEELAIWRTAKTALSVIKSEQPKTMFERLTYDDEGTRKVKPVRRFRTAVGNRSFSARACRIWRLLPDHLKTEDYRKRNIKDAIIKEIKTWDKDWVLWGKDNCERENSSDSSSHTPINRDEHDANDLMNSDKDEAPRNGSITLKKS